MNFKDALKGTLIAVAAAGMFAACGGDEGTAGQQQGQTVQCAGINECAGQGACQGAGHDCAGKNDCKGKGYLEVSKAECAEKGGTEIAS